MSHQRQQLSFYNFEGSNLRLFQDNNGYRVEITAIEPCQWSMITLPKASPEEAFSLAELKVWEGIAKSRAYPALVAEIYHDKEPILATNLRCSKLLGNKPIGSLLSDYMHDEKQYQEFIDTVKNVGFAHHFLDVIDANKKPLRFHAGGLLIKSQICEVLRFYVVFYQKL